MIIGDYNTTLDYSRDRKGYSRTVDTHKNCRALIKTWMEDEKWADAFNYHHTGEKVTLGNPNKKEDKKDELITV